MLSTKEILVPTNLINIAKKTSFVSVGIVCAHHKASMQSAKQAYELDLINPILIGKKKIIQEEADKLNWDIKNITVSGCDPILGLPEANTEFSIWSIG